jgi:hypothetical protein
MEKKRRLQRGAADLVAVAVGITILAITAIGTSSALVYGRQALINQEHFKVATYALRGELEYEMGRFLVFSRYRDDLSSFFNFTPKIVDLDNPNDRGGHVFMTRAVITRDLVEKVNLIETGPTNDYYRIVMRAEWDDAVIAGFLGSSEHNNSGAHHEILLKSTFFQMGDI